jgi:hypothetical protein
MTDETEKLRTDLLRLEKLLRDLTERIATLERNSGPRLEHPTDRAAVRQKVTYDWQS